MQVCSGNQTSAGILPLFFSIDNIQECTLPSRPNVEAAAGSLSETETETETEGPLKHLSLHTHA